MQPVDLTAKIKSPQGPQPTSIAKVKIVFSISLVAFALNSEEGNYSRVIGRPGWKDLVPDKIDLRHAVRDPELDTRTCVRLSARDALLAG